MFFTGAGGFTIVPSVYITEITETSIKGAMGSMVQFMCQVGVTVVFAMDIENIVDWRMITGICIIFPCKYVVGFFLLLSIYVITIWTILGLSAIAMFFMPESPYFLVEKGKLDEAKKSLIWLRGPSNIDEEFNQLKISQDKSKESSNNGDAVTYKDLFTKRVYFEPFITMMFVMFFTHFSGNNGVFFFMKVKQK